MRTGPLSPIYRRVNFANKRGTTKAFRASYDLNATRTEGYADTKPRRKHREMTHKRERLRTPNKDQRGPDK